MNQAIRAIVVGGTLCGVLDLTAACVQWGLRGISPVRIMQSIASGLLGPASFQGGASTAVLGTALHFVIAFSAATVFWLASRKIPWFIQHWVAAGVIFGVLVYIFMNTVVLPLSRARPTAYTLGTVAIGLVVHMVCVGLPISWAARKGGLPGLLH